MNTKILKLILVILLAAFLRLWQLSSVPPSPSLDEVSIGYNAYSILQTGRDEYGILFPILLRAYDDWRPAMHVYTSLPFVKLLGPSALAVRLPSAILSILTVLATYFLVKRLCKNESIALIATLLLAISPWHIYISRLGHEVNEGLAFAVLAVLFSFKKQVLPAVLFFILAFISYHTDKAFIPLLLFGSLLIFWKQVILVKKKILVGLCIAVVAIAPFIRESVSSEGLSRMKGANVFAAQEPRFYERVQFLAEAGEKHDLIGEILYNRRILAGEILFSGYISHFNPSWLFANIADEKHKIPSIGLLYFWELPFVLLGLFLLVTTKGIDRKIKQFIFLWIIVAPVAASFASDTPHTMRSFVFLPTWQIVSAIGIVAVLDFFGRKKLVRGIFLGVVLLSTLYLYKQYFEVFPKTQSPSFQYALSQAVPFVLLHEKQYDKIVFSNEDNLTQAYMF